MEGIEDAGLQLNLEVLGSLREIMGCLVAVPTQGTLQAVYAEGQGSFVTIVQSMHELQCPIAFLSLVASTWK